MSSLETQINSLTGQATLNPKMLDPALFEEPETHDGYGMPRLGGFTKVSGSLPVIALGVIMSSTVGGFLSKYLPSMTQWASVIAGALIMYFAKRQKLLKDFGAGVLIGGLASVFSGIGSSLSGAFGEPRDSFEEDRTTWGGVEGGTMVTSPDRRTLR